MVLDGRFPVLGLMSENACAGGSAAAEGFVGMCWLAANQIGAYDGPMQIAIECELDSNAVSGQQFQDHGITRSRGVQFS